MACTGRIIQGCLTAGSQTQLRRRRAVGFDPTCDGPLTLGDLGGRHAFTIGDSLIPGNSSTNGVVEPYSSASKVSMGGPVYGAGASLGGAGSPACSSAAAFSGMAAGGAALIMASGGHGKLLLQGSGKHMPQPASADAQPGASDARAAAAQQWQKAVVANILCMEPAVHRLLVPSPDVPPAPSPRQDMRKQPVFHTWRDSQQSLLHM